MAERFVNFPCGYDELTGVLHVPDTEQRAVGIVIVVGGPQYRVGSHRQFVVMARGLAAAGYPVLRFDYRGMGDSSGGRRTFEEVNQDIRAAIDRLLAELPAIHGAVVFGLCDAASAALMYCQSDPRVHGLILANPWVRTEAGAAKAVVRHYYGQRLLQQSFWAKVVSGRFQVIASIRGFVTSVWNSRRTQDRRVPQRPTNFISRMLDGFTHFAGPTLLVLSGRDLTAREFQDLCQDSRAWAGVINAPNVRVFEVVDADHTFSSATSLQAVVAALVRWLEECGAGA